MTTAIDWLDWMSSDDFPEQLGDLATWVTAVVASAALVAAVRAGRAAQRSADAGVAAAEATVKSARAAQKLNEREELRDRERGAASEQEQANRVSAWMQRSDDPSLPDGAYLRNASDLPIYDVTVTLHLRTEAPVQTWPTVGVSETQFVVPPAPDPQLLPTSFKATEETMVLEGEDQPVLAAAVEFRDAANRSWIRRADGTLARHIVLTDTVGVTSSTETDTTADGTAS